jgi:hypothetical protein
MFWGQFRPGGRRGLHHDAKSPRIGYQSGDYQSEGLQMNGCISADLVRMARSVVERVDGHGETGPSVLHATLLASRLYEALKIELDTMGRHDPAKVGVLAAAIDQCRRAVRTPVSLPLMAAELKRVLTLLEQATPTPAPVERLRRFRVIEGGLSRST